MVENVVDQNQAYVIVEFASAFDMCRPIDLDARIKYLKKLHTLHGTNYIHEIPKVDDGRKDYNISLLQKRKLNCSEKKITHQFQNVWPIFNKVWLQYRECIKDQHINFVNHILSNYTITHPDVCDLMMILITIAPSTRPLEQSFSKLCKICFKDRNNLLIKNLETLYLLAANNYPKIDYVKTIEILESHWLLGLFVCCLCFQSALSEFMYVYHSFFLYIYRVLGFWLKFFIFKLFILMKEKLSPFSAYAKFFHRWKF